MKRNAWENSRHWPVSYRSQDEAGLPDGDLRDDEVRGEHWFWFSALFILIVIAPAIVEWLA